MGTFAICVSPWSCCVAETPNSEGGDMKRRILQAWVLPAVLLAALAFAGGAEALDFRGIGLKCGVDFSQTQDLGYVGGGMGFDSARLVLGSHLDLGPLLLPKLHLVPGVDVILEKDLNVLSLNGDVRYYFLQEAGVAGYFGGGVGTHFYRFDAASVQNNTKVTLNVPIGFQRKLSRGTLWFGELKLVIADEEVDSSFRITVGLTLGAGE